MANQTPFNDFPLVVFFTSRGSWLSVSVLCPHGRLFSFHCFCERCFPHEFKPCARRRLEKHQEILVLTSRGSFSINRSTTSAPMLSRCVLAQESTSVALLDRSMTFTRSTNRLNTPATFFCKSIFLDTNLVYLAACSSALPTDCSTCLSINV